MRLLEAGRQPALDRGGAGTAHSSDVPPESRIYAALSCQADKRLYLCPSAQRRKSWECLPAGLPGVPAGSSPGRVKRQRAGPGAAVC